MMIKEKNVFTALVLLLVSGFTSPLVAQGTAVLIPTGQSTIDGRSWLSYSGPGGMRILALAPFPEDAGQRLERTVAVIAAWPTIRITELRAESSKGVDDFVLTLSSIQSEGRDYSSNVPGGIRLRYDGALMYDFRVRSGDYFVRVRGVLMDEASLMAEIVKAVNDPGGYIAERDPSWLALHIEMLDKVNTQQDRRMELLDSRMVEINRLLTQKTDATSKLLVSRTLELEVLIESRSKEANSNMESRTAGIQSRMETMAEEFETRLEQVYKEADEDRNKLEAILRASQTQFESLADALRIALASEMNKGLFGGPRPLDSAILEHVRALKASNSSLDRAMALESAKAAGLKAKAKEMDIIFRIWFGE